MKIKTISSSDLLLQYILKKIHVLSNLYLQSLEENFQDFNSFKHYIKNTMNIVNLIILEKSYNFEEVSLKLANLLVTKLLFYFKIYSYNHDMVQPIEIPDDIIDVKTIKKLLQNKFVVLNKILGTNNIIFEINLDLMMFPQSNDLIYEITDLVELLKGFNWKKEEYDIVGKVLEKNILRRKKHNYGQFFTEPDIIDLIISLCKHNEKDIVLDYACGTGSFLMRIYSFKKLLNKHLTHKQLLEMIFGVEIEKYIAAVAKLNLMTKDLSCKNVQPNIIQNDFFSPGIFSKYNLNAANMKIFDLIIGNPPYTRQERINSLGINKNRLFENSFKGVSKEKKFVLSKRAGLYAYFIIHATKFVKENGFCGFIVSNSWLDTDWGLDFQQFLLGHYKILFIIESKVERWFSDAGTNTCIMIMQRSKFINARMRNLTRFVQIKKPLNSLIPPLGKTLNAYQRRMKHLTSLKHFIELKKEYYEDNTIKIIPILQEKLKKNYSTPMEKFNLRRKLNFYFKAPHVFYRILENGKEYFVQLTSIAKTRCGIKTGANEFFYLTDVLIRKKGIEKEFWMHQTKTGEWIPNYLIKSPRDCKSVIIKQKELKHRLLVVSKHKSELKGTNVLKYIEEGEKKGFNKRRSCSRRSRWYDIGKQVKGKILWEIVQYERLKAPYNKFNVIIDHNFFEIIPNDPKEELTVIAQLNSSLYAMVREIWGRSNLGEGSLKTEGVDILKFPIIDPNRIPSKIKENLKEAFIQYAKTPEVKSILTEIGAKKPQEVSLNRISPNRRRLDRIILEDLLHLTKEEQIEFYQNIVDLTSSRINRARNN